MRRKPLSPGIVKISARIINFWSSRKASDGRGWGWFYVLKYYYQIKVSGTRLELFL